MLEDSTVQTFFGLTGPEWEALGYGLKDGLKFWKRTHIKYSEIDTLEISPQLKAAIKDEFHYYEIGSDLPEDIVLAIGIGYLVYTGQAVGLLKTVLVGAGIAI